MEIKNIKACGDYVIIKVVKIEKKEDNKTKSGIILLNKEENENTKTNINGERVTAVFYVNEIGPLVNKDTCGFKVGDEVVVNGYDTQYVGDDKDNLFAICKAESIKCVVESER